MPPEKRRVNGFEKALNQIKAAFTNDAIADMEYGEQQLKRVDLLWDKLEETYAAFEDEYPEPEKHVLEEPDKTQVYQDGSSSMTEPAIYTSPPFRRLIRFWLA